MRRIVGATIIYNNRFKVSVSLRLDRIKALFQIRRDIVNGNDDIKRVLGVLARLLLGGAVLRFEIFKKYPLKNFVKF